MNIVEYIDMKSAFLATFYAILIFAVATKSAHAYLDPGTGSYVLQIIAAVFLAGTVVIKGFSRQIRDLFQNIFSRKGKDSENRSSKNS